MRLDRLDLTRYGRFTDRVLHFPAPAAGAPDLHVIHGPNEAGKSTLFSAWLDLLYGIPLRSKYGFLHDGPLMRLGARLSQGGTVLDIARLKRNSGSLLDGAGQPLPEAVLQGLLGGLGREGYAAMFSLDDDTLEEGGNAILSSRGDLGEMLFSASAGLAGLAPQLEAMRKGLDAFHKPGGRKSLLKDRRDRLKELDAAREALDTSASRLQRLQRERVAAERDWQAAAQAEDGLRRALDLLRQSLTLMPQRARAERLRAELAPLAHLPPASPAEAATLAALEQELRQFQGQAQARAETRALTEARLAMLPRDPAILPLAEAIAAAGGLRAAHLTALDDLPRRRQDLAVVQAETGALLRRLDLQDPALLPGPLLQRLRALAADLGPLSTALATARAEETAAADRLATALAAGEPQETDLRSLAALMASLRSEDPEAALARATQARARAEADLARATLALAPWSGQDLPQPLPAWTLAAWERTAAATEAALADARPALARAKADLARLTPAALRSPSLAEAAEIRRQREAAWVAHLAALTPETAARFETLLRQDDQLTRQRAEAERLAEAQAQRAEAEAALAAAEARLTEAEAARQAHLDEVAAATAALGLAGAGLSDLIAWTQRLHQAHAARQALDEARTDTAEAALTAGAQALAQALALPPAPFALLKVEAQARLDRAHETSETLRRLAALRADLGQRRAAAARAEAAIQTWTADWQALAPPSLLPGTDLLERLSGLDQLAQLAHRAADLADRIAKMEANSAAFQEAAAAIQQRLDLAEMPHWDEIPARLARALQTEEQHRQLRSDLDALRLAEDEAARLAALRHQARQELAAALHWDGTGSLADHLGLCLRAADLRATLAELDDSLAAHPAPDRDAAALQAEVTRLELEHTLARDRTAQAYAALTAAQAELDRVGGDEAVARLASDRANLLLQLAEESRTHLADRLALTTLEAGLRRYRDSHRSAMLARASEAFRRLSQGAYTGLGAEPEGTSEVLVAIPAQGGAKRADDLSKGTRFQLYLALRIAGYHELAKSRPPVPFIADDIMETFDEGRSAQALTLLAEMSRTGQVIYLTHHAHICDLARAVCPEVRLLDLAQGA